jgi:cytochrome P450 family 6
MLLSRNRDLARKLRMKILPEDISSFYMNVVRDTVKYREDNKVERNDFMDLLIKMKNSNGDDKLTLNQVRTFHSQAHCYRFLNFY